MNQDQNPAPNNVRQQVIDAIKKSNNILITVSQNPSIDQLASCLAIALILNKLNKHATAIFSGNIPSTLEFLQPEKTLETNTNSLRDFIISLDREKADKLRYKVEDNVVRIFITPYRTSLSQDDLVFSQGDFNVDLVLALGVDQREHLDLAIMQQGRILHDAVVIGLSAGEVPSSVGAINWHEPKASSISEIIVGLSESLQGGLMDGQISTALLTGIVAETDRFRNDKTNAKVMSISAQLMSLGANQQLVAQQLEPVASTMAVNTEAAPMPSMSSPSQESSFDVPQVGEQGPSEAAVSLHIDPNAPAPAVQLPGDDGEEDIKKIKIDEAGIIHDDVPLVPAEDQLINKPHKVIQPLTEQQNKPTSSYIFSPPQMGGTLTAEAQDSSMTELPNPTTQSPQQTPILSHDSPIASAPPAPTNTPAIETVSPVAPAKPAVPEVPPAPQAPVSQPAPAQAPSMPAPTPEPNLGQQPNPSVNEAPAINQEDARRAVLEAVASASAPIAPSPIVALNAQPMDLSAPTQSNPSTNQLPPPPLPPPLAPMPEVPAPQAPVSQPAPEPSTPAPQAQPSPQVGNTPFNLPPPQ